MTRNQILFLGSGTNPNVPAIIDYLLLHGANYTRINIEELVQYSNIELEFSGSHSGGGTLTEPADYCVALDDISCVYWSGWASPCADHVYPVRGRNLFSNEVRSSLEMVIDLLADRDWMNWPNSNRNAIVKSAQYRAALEAGINIPPTIITTSPEQARTFVRKHGKVVVKTVGQGADWEVAGKVIVTGTLTNSPKDLKRLDRVAICPTLLQRYIEPLLEFRVTVVGSDVFVAAFDSALLPDSVVDSRLGVVDGIPYVPWKLPEDIESSLAKVLQALSLRYGAMDVIFGTDHNYYLLEVNPSGQWTGVEAITGLPITESIAMHLMSSR